MARAGRAVAVVLVVCAAWTAGAGAAEPPTPWDGSNPFACTLQQAGFGATVPDPEADPFCIEFDKRRQNVNELGVVDFISKEPARVAAASSKCFYFQSDHWRGSLVQDDGSTKTYEWDGHYFFDKARAEGGAWVSNFNFAGQTGDPRTVPGFPDEWKPFFGPGTGGVRTHDNVQGDPNCAARAAREGFRIYAGAAGPPARCLTPAGTVGRRHLGPVGVGGREGAIRRALGPPLVVKRGWLRWCVRGGGRFLIALAGDRSGDLGTGETSPALILLSTQRRFRYRGAGPGKSRHALRRALRRPRKLVRYGDVTVYARTRHSPLLFGVRRGRIRFVAVRNARAIATRRALGGYLRRAAG